MFYYPPNQADKTQLNLVAAFEHISHTWSREKRSMHGVFSLCVNKMFEFKILCFKHLQSHLE